MRVASSGNFVGQCPIMFRLGETTKLKVIKARHELIYAELGDSTGEFSLDI